MQTYKHIKAGSNINIKKKGLNCDKCWWVKFIFG